MPASLQSGSDLPKSAEEPRLRAHFHGDHQCNHDVEQSDCPDVLRRFHRQPHLCGSCRAGILLIRSDPPHLILKPIPLRSPVMVVPPNNYVRINGMVAMTSLRLLLELLGPEGSPEGGFNARDQEDQVTPGRSELVSHLDPVMPVLDCLLRLSIALNDLQLRQRNRQLPLVFPKRLHEHLP